MERRPPGEPSGHPRQGTSARRRAAAASRSASRKVGGKVGGATRGAAGSTYRMVRQATNAQGAGETGLARVIEMHAVSAAGDALVVLSLASTIFFSVPVGEARGRVALYLLVTMLPFSVMAPVIGPVLDRFRHGRRYALATTLVTRAFLAWVMAGAVAGGKEAFALYPAAFGQLVASKAYGVTRAAATPRVLPPALSLVTANSRVMLGGIVGVALATPVGVAVLRVVGNEWSLRLAFLVFLVGTVLALRLPARVDSSAGEVGARLTSEEGPTQDRSAPPTTGYWGIGPQVVLGLRATAALRAFTGFLTLFLAFALRSEPISSLPVLGVIGLVAGAAGLGNTLGTSLGAVLRRLRPETVVTGMVALAALAAGLGALAYGVPALMVTGLVAGLASALGKLSLDALVQREVPDAVRTSAFARSETVLQLAWVVGGGVAIALPVPGPWGLGLAAVGLTAATVVTLRSLVRQRRGRRRTPPRARPRTAG